MLLTHVVTIILILDTIHLTETHSLYGTMCTQMLGNIAKLVKQERVISHIFVP